MQLQCITYNTCFGCQSDTLESGKKDRTAQPLASSTCHPQPTATICRKGAASCLAKLISPGHVLIGIQEATRAQELLQVLRSLKPTLSLQLYEKSFGHHGAVAFFVEDTLFELKSQNSGLIVAGRPFLVLVGHVRGHEKEALLLINCHAPHHTAGFAHLLEERLSDALSTDRAGLAFLATCRSVHAIAFGDWNDHGDYDLWKGVHLYMAPSLPNAVRGIYLACPQRPPKSCCHTTSQDRDTRYGDYCLATPHIRWLRANWMMPTLCPPSSDHSPVASLLEISLGAALTTPNLAIDRASAARPPSAISSSPGGSSAKKGSDSAAASSTHVTPQLPYDPYFWTHDYPVQARAASQFPYDSYSGAYDYPMQDSRPYRYSAQRSHGPTTVVPVHSRSSGRAARRTRLQYLSHLAQDPFERDTVAFHYDPYRWSDGSHTQWA